VRWCMRWLASQSNRASPPLSAKEQTLALQSSRSLRTSLIFLNGEKLKKLRGAKCDDTGGAMTIPRDSVSIWAGGHAARLGKVWSLRLRARTRARTVGSVRHIRDHQ
jgi:hypothetical protein